VWHAGAWALIGAFALPPISWLAFRIFQHKHAPARIAFSPFAGGFAGGYFEAMALRSESCKDLEGMLCILSSSGDELPFIILAAMLSVVFIYLCFPGRKVPEKPVEFGEDLFD